MNTEVKRSLLLPYVLVAFAVALVLCVAAVQVVLAQSDDETINGCYNTKTGRLKVVDDPNQCKKKQTPISWNKNGPQGPAGPAGPQGQTSPFAFAKVETPTPPVSTTSDYEDLGGPGVTVDVPASGFIEVGASAFVTGGEGAVSLFDVSTDAAIPGQSDLCADFLGSPPNEGVLFISPDTSPDPALEETYSTPAGLPNFLGSCANTGGPGTVLLGPLSPGSYDLELRYASCGCSGVPVTFSERQLWARPAP